MDLADGKSLSFCYFHQVEGHCCHDCHVVCPRIASWWNYDALQIEGVVDVAREKNLVS
jgi:hypothetical protein